MRAQGNERLRAILFGVHLPTLIGAKQVSPKLWRALCPFHDDTHPSLTARHTDKGWKFRCWGCGESGSTVDFLRKRDGLTFPQALDALDGGQPLPPAPPAKPRYWRLLVCDACGVESVEVRDVAHLNELADEGRTLGHWEIAPDAIAAVGPVCLSRNSVRAAPVPSIHSHRAA